MAINNFNGFKVNLTQAQYDTLKSTGTVIVEGQTITFDENTIYHVYDEGGLPVAAGSGITITSGDTVTISVSDTVAQTNKTNIFSGAQTVNGDLTVAGNIYQSGTTYETHAEQLYTQKDYIVLRENATNSLGTEYSGLKIIKYNGTDDLNFVVGADGMARVGKVGDEQPLATREESPISNGFAYWDDTNNRFNTQDLTGKISPDTTKVIFNEDGSVRFYGSSTSNYTDISGATIEVHTSNNTGEYVKITSGGIYFPKTNNKFGQHNNDPYAYGLSLMDTNTGGHGTSSSTANSAYRYSFKDLIPAESASRIYQRVNDPYYRSINDIVVLCNQTSEDYDYELGHIYKISVDKSNTTYQWSIQDITPTSGGSSITVDSELSSTSENPVQNKVIYADIYEPLLGKQDTISTFSIDSNSVTNPPTVVENYIAFDANINIGGSQLQDQQIIIPLKAGNNISLTVDSANKAVLINSTGGIGIDKIQSIGICNTINGSNIYGTGFGVTGTFSISYLDDSSATQYLSGQASVNIPLVAGDGITLEKSTAVGDQSIIVSAEGVTVDSELSTTSTNAVQNSVITNALNSKQNTLTAGSNISIEDNEISVNGNTYELGVSMNNYTKISSTIGSNGYAFYLRFLATRDIAVGSITPITNGTVYNMKFAGNGTYNGESVYYFSSNLLVNGEVYPTVITISSSNVWTIYCNGSNATLNSTDLGGAILAY